MCRAKQGKAQPFKKMAIDCRAISSEAFSYKALIYNNEMNSEVRRGNEARWLPTAMAMELKVFRLSLSASKG